jgi:hypothetical protein
MAKKKAALARKPGKVNLSGGSGQSSSGTDLKGGGASTGGGKTTKTVAKNNK